MLFNPLSARGQQVHFYGAELPPLIHEYDDRRLGGFAVDLLREVVKDSGGELSEPKIHNMPWARALSECKNSSQAALLSMSMLPERKAKYKWVGPIARVRMGFYAMKSSNISICRIEDISRYRVGVVRNTAPTKLLPKISGLEDIRLEQVNNIRASIRMLRAGRLDLSMQSEPGFSALLREMGFAREEFVKVYDLGSVMMYYAFNLDFDDAYIRRLQFGLNALKAKSSDGGLSRYEVLCRKYWPHGFSANCAPLSR